MEIDLIGQIREIFDKSVKTEDYFDTKNNFTGRELSDIISKPDSGKYKSSIDALFRNLNI
ncbi:MAG TPA: hypothetical protein DCP02_00210 [Actinobacteria bacterium]|nr:hypothetical protein [Actinomycetota bacterium]